MSVELATAWVRIVPSVSGIQGAMATQLAPAQGIAAAHGAKAGKAYGSRFIGGLGGSIKSMAATAGVLFSVIGIARFLGDSINAVKKWETLQAQTQAAVKSTGGAANVTAAQVHGLALALENQTRTEAESITSGANMLLTFRNIRNEAGQGNDIFNQSTRALVDLSRAMGTEPRNAAIQLGKALNDPIKGMSALMRVGIQFDDVQKAQIKKFVEAGDIMGAQKIILKELNDEFGGSGAAFADTYAGKLEHVKDAAGDFGEKIVGHIIPALATMADMASNRVFPALEKAFDQKTPEKFFAVLTKGFGAGSLSAEGGPLSLPAWTHGWDQIMGMMNRAWVHGTDQMAAGWIDWFHVVGDNWNSGIADMGDNWNSGIADMANNWNTGIADMGNNWNTGIADMGANWNSGIADMGANWNSGIASMGANWNSGIAGFVSNWNFGMGQFHNGFIQIQTWWNGLISSFSSGWFQITGFFGNGWVTITGRFSNGFAQITGWWNGLMGSFSRGWDQLRSGAAGVFNGLGQIVSSTFSGMATNIGNAVKGIINVIAGPINLIKDVINNFGKIKIPWLGIGDAPGNFRGTAIGGGAALARVRSMLPPGLRITSTYRTPAQNAAVGGVPGSLHTDRNNPAVDIAGPTRLLDAFAAQLARVNHWRQLLWRVPGHYDHIHVAHAGGMVAGSWPRSLGDGPDERTARLKVGEAVLSTPLVDFLSRALSAVGEPGSGTHELVGQLFLDSGELLGIVRGQVREAKDAQDQAIRGGLR